MASTFTQHTVNTCTEVFQDLKGNKCLDSTGKTTAVDTVCTLTLQVMLTHCQRKSHILVLLIAGRNNVL